jgi:hypothetical protein
MAKDNSPCYKDGVDCPKRTVHPNCHSTCPEYKKYSDGLTAKNEFIRKKKAEDAMVTETRIKARTRTSGTKLKQGVWKG